MKYIILFLLLVPLADSLQINEIMYNPRGSDKDAEWVELYNPNNEIIDFEDYYFFSDDKEMQWVADYYDEAFDSNATYILIASCESKLYDFVDNNIIFNPLTLGPENENGEAEITTCRKVGNNLKNSFDVAEIWHCPEEGVLDDMYDTCYEVDSFDYNSTVGANGNGMSLQLIQYLMSCCIQPLDL